LARRPSSGGTEPRTTTLTIRLPEEARALIEQRATAAGMTVSAYGARILLGGRVGADRQDVLDPTRKAELSRIGHSIVQLGQAVRSGQMPEAKTAIVAMEDLLTWLLRDELTRRRVQAYETERRADGPQDSPPRHEFQRRVGLSPAR
jgi:hypothetical protein